MNDNKFDNHIIRKVRELDDSYPDNLASEDSLWQQIVIRRKQREAKLTRIQWCIAASLLIMVMVGTFWLNSNYHAPGDNVLSDREITTVKKDEALEYIEKFCRGNNISCNSPAFRELQDELKESSSSLMEIDKQITLFGTDARLVRAKIRIENHQANIIRAMAQTL